MNLMYERARVVDAYGNMFELQPDGNSLDFLAGMIRKKIL